MPTIADYLDDAPKRKTDNFQVDLYYLHVPRAIVKRAAEELSAGRQALDKFDSWDWGGIGTDGVLPDVPDANYNGNKFEYHIRDLVGNRNSGPSTYIEDQIVNAGRLKPAIIAGNAWARRGAKIGDVASKRTWDGNDTASKIVGNLSQKARDAKLSNDIVSGLDNVSTQINDHTHVTPGSMFYGPGNVAKEINNSWNQLVTDKEVEDYFKGLGLTDEQIKQYVDEYNKAYFQPEVEANDYKDNFYGWLDKYPGLRGALRYATPWLAYGVPLSAIGSMMGTNALWGPTILGAVGAGAYGYGVGSGYLRDFAQNNSFGQLLDTIHSTANKPIGALWNYLEPGTGRVGNRFLVEPDTYPEADRPKQDEKSTGSNTTAYNPLYGPRNIYTQGSKPFTHAPSLMQLPDYSTPEQSNLEMNA